MGTVRSYAGPHKGLRNILSQFTTLAGRTDAADPVQLEGLKDLGRKMFLLLNDHVHHENGNTLAHLEERVAGASQHDLHEHEELEKLQNVLQQKLEHLNNTASAEDMHLFYLEAAYFHALYLLHIHHEETVTEKLLQAYFSDEELIGHHLEVVQNIAFETMLLWMRYMIPAQPEKEALQMLSGIKASAPAEAFSAVLAAIQPEMVPDRYVSITSKL